ncbi:MAG TPA: hypothetical protein VGR78_17020, partial [Verrucomicrobiae bacterium]|nr:hypothetical protein [Verrucomicrobiae bacterium]
PAEKAAVGGVRLAIVAICAGLIAAQTVSSLVTTQIKGIAGTEQDTQAKEQKWDFATQWSLPKLETLRVIIPGLFGYRMDTPDGGNYWGNVGEQPGWEVHHQGFRRHSGSGEYAGVLVVMLALWAVFQSFRSAKSLFDERQRKFIWFWGCVAVLGLLFAYGRHAPFYRLVYALPYFSTIRNPIKFTVPFQIAIIILFGYGVDGIARGCLAQARGKIAPFQQNFKNWWASASLFDKRWSQGLGAAVLVSLLGFLVFYSSRGELEGYLGKGGFAPAEAKVIASFSYKEVAWFLFFLALNAGLVSAILSGFFAGARAKVGATLLIAVLLGDLIRANQPWIIYYDYKEKLATNPVLDILRDKPYEHRVTVLQLDPAKIPQQAAAALNALRQVYQILWAQHHFPFYNIQSIDMTQESRVGQDKTTFLSAFTNSPADRYWELTTTRYFLGLSGATLPGFRVHAPFTLAQDRADGSITAQTNASGPFAVLEYTNALPRASLYTQWQVQTNDQATLQTLTNLTFDLHQTVLVADELPAPASNPKTNGPAGAVEISRYEPKRLVLKSDALSATVLMLTDRFDPDWHVWVDGKPDRVLRCDFIMRGVYVPAGSHTIEFKFQPPKTALWITLGALGIGAGLLLILILTPASKRLDSMASAANVT